MRKWIKKKVERALDPLRERENQVISFNRVSETTSEVVVFHWLRMTNRTDMPLREETPSR